MPIDPMATIEDHPNYTVICAFVDWLIPKIRAAQASYFAAHGRYFQGIETPEAVPDGMKLEIADYSRRPTDQVQDWRAFDDRTFSTEAKTPVQIAIDVYRAPRGHGWILRCELWRDGHWMFRHHEGPETWPSAVDEWFLEPEDSI